MIRKQIPAEDFIIRPHHLWHHQWLLLTSGDFQSGDYNCMTVGWGSIGTMWSKPVVQVVARPTRYTHQFMEKYPTFTLSAFNDSYRDDLQLLGSKSGRNGNKLAETKLTPIPSNRVAAPGFAEAELIIECRKIYHDVLHPENFLDATIDKNYPKKDYHSVYFGKIEAIFGVGSR